MRKLITLNIAATLEELKSKPRSDQSPPDTFDVDHHRHSQRLLDIIDELHRLIDESTEKPTRRKLLQTLASTTQLFAKHLDEKSDHEFFVANDNRQVWVVDHITGAPSRAGRLEADQWTASRGQPWMGDVKKLRAVIRSARRNGEKIPAGNFGLRVLRTVKIARERTDKDAQEWDNTQPILDPRFP